jgi:transcription elongation factor GreA
MRRVYSTDMISAKILLTQNGFDAFTQELADLRTKRDPTVLRLQAAREQGDLSENGAYKAARFELSDIDRNIRRLSYVLKYAVVQSPPIDGTIGFGSTVTLMKGGKKFLYQLVSTYEADPAQGKLSLDSLLGKELNGKQIGDAVTIKAPAGVMDYVIVDVK